MASGRTHNSYAGAPITCLPSVPPCSAHPVSCFWCVYNKPPRPSHAPFGQYTRGPCAQPERYTATKGDRTGTRYAHKAPAFGILVLKYGPLRPLPALSALLHHGSHLKGVGEQHEYGSEAARSEDGSSSSGSRDGPSFGRPSSPTTVLRLDDM